MDGERSSALMAAPSTQTRISEHVDPKQSAVSRYGAQKEDEEGEEMRGRGLIARLHDAHVGDAIDTGAVALLQADSVSRVNRVTRHNSLHAGLLLMKWRPVYAFPRFPISSINNALLACTFNIRRERAALYFRFAPFTARILAGEISKYPVWLTEQNFNPRRNECSHAAIKIIIKIIMPTSIISEYVCVCV